MGIECVHLECLTFASKNWARLKHKNYFCAEFLEEIQYQRSMMKWAPSNADTFLQRPYQIGT